MKTKIKITGISKKDAYYCDRKYILGLVGHLDVEEGLRKGYYGGAFKPVANKDWKKIKELGWGRAFFFAAIKFEEVE